MHLHAYRIVTDNRRRGMRGATEGGNSNLEDALNSFFASVAEAVRDRSQLEGEFHTADGHLLVTVRITPLKPLKGVPK